MNIIVLMGSPNRKGSTSILVDSFSKGAKEAGHKVEILDICHANIHPCTGCIHCGYEGECIQKDFMTEVRGKILSSDMIVFATPLYYYGFSSQMKIVIDRFCSFNSSLTRKRMKSLLISVAWNSDSWTFDALEAHYKTLVRYLSFQDQGMILGRGCGTPSMTSMSKYVKEAYQVGLMLR